LKNESAFAIVDNIKDTSEEHSYPMGFDELDTITSVISFFDNE
jgi:hypothetical protein